MWTFHNQTSINHIENKDVELLINYSPCLPQEVGSVQSNRTSNLQIQLNEQFE